MPFEPAAPRRRQHRLTAGAFAISLFIAAVAAPAQNPAPAVDPTGETFRRRPEIRELLELKQERSNLQGFVATSREPAAIKKSREQARLFNQRVNAYLDRLEKQYSAATVQRALLGADTKRGPVDPYENLRLWLQSQPDHPPGNDRRIVFASSTLLDPGATAFRIDPARLKQALQDELIAVYVYIGRDQDPGWRVAQAACGLFALTAPCLASDWKVVLPWVPGKPQHGVVFGFDEKPDAVLNLGQTESLTYVRHAIAKAD